MEMQFKTLRNTSGNSLTPKESPDNSLPDDTMSPSMSPTITNDTENVTMSPPQNHHVTMSPNDTKRHTVRVGSEAFTVLKMVSQQYSCSLKKAVDLVTRSYVTNGDSLSGQ